MSDFTDVEIANLALYRCGASLRLTALDDDTADGRMVNSLYAFVINLMLRQYPWNFATRAAALADLDDEDTLMVGWGYQYAYPADCAYARQVCDENGARLTWYQVVPGVLPVQWLQPRVPFVVSSNSAHGKIILTDLSEAYLVYTAKITDTTLFDEAFCSAAASRLAMELVTPMHGDARMKSECARQFSYEISQAFSLSANEGVRDANPESPSIMARN